MFIGLCVFILFCFSKLKIYIHNLCLVLSWITEPRQDAGERLGFQTYSVRIFKT
jgi:hypothetical protein